MPVLFVSSEESDIGHYRKKGYWARWIIGHTRSDGSYVLLTFLYCLFPVSPWILLLLHTLLFLSSPSAVFSICLSQMPQNLLIPFLPLWFLSRMFCSVFEKSRGENISLLSVPSYTGFQVKVWELVFACAFHTGDFCREEKSHLILLN